MPIPANTRKPLDAVLHTKSQHSLKWGLHSRLDNGCWHPKPAGIAHTKPSHSEAARRFYDYHGRTPSAGVLVDHMELAWACFTKRSVAHRSRRSCYDIRPRPRLLSTALYQICLPLSEKRLAIEAIRDSF